MIELYARPNANTYTESIVFKTSIFESINGYRNTKELLSESRYRCKYSSLLFHTGRHRSFINMFMLGLTATILQPLWGQPTYITQTALGVTTIPCIPVYSDFNVGDKVFITYGYDTFNVVTLLEINGNNLVIDEAVDIKEGNIVLPSFTGVVSGEVNSTYSGENYAMCEINVES